MKHIAILFGVVIGLKLLDELTRGRKRTRSRSRYRKPAPPSGSSTLGDELAAVMRGLVKLFAPRPPPLQYRAESIPSPALQTDEVALASSQSVTTASLPSPPPQEETAQITLDLLQELEWKRFEQVTEAYFERTGWRTEPARFGADGGVDIHLFRPAEERVAAVVQCKAWNTYKVGVKPVRELFGVMAAASASEGFFVTSGSYTEEACSFARGKTLTLIDGEGLIERIHALPSTDQRQIYDIATAGDYRTPSCPRCGRKMVMRIAAKGRSVGDSFWGCPGYPRCNQTLQMRSDEQSSGGRQAWSVHAALTGRTSR